MRRLISLLLAFSLFHQTAFAGVTTSNPQTAMLFVDDYLAMKPANGMFAEIADLEYLAEDIVPQFESLEPEDFNVFLLNVLERYIFEPQNRKALASLLKIIRSSIAPQLEYTAKLREDQAGIILEGGMVYGFMILMTLLVLRKPLARPISRMKFVQNLRRNQVALAEKSKILKYTGRVFGNSFVTTFAMGAGLRKVEYMLETSRAHRLDPLVLLKIVQTSLACQISYDSLDLYTKVEKLSSDETQMKAQKLKLHQQLSSLTSQSAELLEQFGWLSNLDIKDPLFQKMLAEVPTARSWQELRKQLTEEENSTDGRCRQVGLTYVQEQLGVLAQVLPALELPTSIQRPAYEVSPR